MFWIRFAIVFVIGWEAFTRLIFLPYLRSKGFRRTFEIKQYFYKNIVLAFIIVAGVFIEWFSIIMAALEFVHFIK